MDNTFVLLWRKITGTSFYKNPEVCHLAMHCIIKATYKPKDILWNNQFIHLELGQFITGRKSLASDTGLSEQKVRTGLKILEKCKFLTSRSTNKYSIITVSNYREYQNPSGEINQQSNQQPTSNQPATNQQLTTNNKENKDNKEIINRIVAYLNEKTGKNFKPSTDDTVKKINARLSEGYTEEEFKRVIDIKVKEWIKDPKMSKYLCPETLFRPSRFEKYLNEAPVEQTFKPKIFKPEEIRRIPLNHGS